jgi:hypothetical protein
VAIVAVRDWLRDRGIAYVYVIAPIKQTIYPESFRLHHEARTRDGYGPAGGLPGEHTDVMDGRSEKTAPVEKKRHHGLLQDRYPLEPLRRERGAARDHERVRQHLLDRLTFLLDDRSFEQFAGKGGDLASSQR